MTELPRWELDDCIWEQDDQQQVMSLIACRGTDLSKFSKSQHELVRLAMPVRRHAGAATTPCASSAMPRQFAYCPFCGAALVDEPAGTPSETWIPPYGAGDGTRVFRQLPFEDAAGAGARAGTAAQIGGVSEFALPRRGANLNFMVGRFGTNHSLLACIDKSGGLVDVFLPAAAAWVTLARLGPSTDSSRQPDWSWSAAMVDLPGTSGMCWPTPEGPLFCKIDLVATTSTVTLGVGRCIGGAARLAGVCVIPVEVNGKLALGRFDAASQGWVNQEVGQAAPSGYLGIPVIDAMREKIYWVGHDGYLTCTVRAGQLISGWSTWDTRGKSCQGQPEYGPPHIDRNNRYWQLCLYTERDPSFRYYELGGTQDDFHAEVAGEMLSTGRTGFDLTYNYWNDPWDPANGDRFEVIRMPLLQFGDNNDTATVVTMSVAGESLLIGEMFDRALGFVDREAKNLEFTLLSRENLPRRFDLGTEIISTKRPWECKAFVFQDHFHIYVPDKIKCYRWPMRSARS